MAMEYRILPHGGEKISVIGMGMAYINESDEKEIENTVRTAIDLGVNYFDFIPSNTKPFEPYARALKGLREKVMLQVHLGASYKTGEYGWTRNMEEIKHEGVLTCWGPIMLTLASFIVWTMSRILKP